MFDMAPWGPFGVNKKRSIFLEVVLVGGDIARAGLIRDDGAADEAFLHQSPDAFVHIFLFHGDPGFGYAGECTPICVDTRRID